MNNYLFSGHELIPAEPVPVLTSNLDQVLLVFLLKLLSDPFLFIGFVPCPFLVVFCPAYSHLFNVVV